MSFSLPADSPSQGHFLVATTDDVGYSRVVGLATMHNSLGLKRFLDHLLQKGFRRFVLDFSECRGFDSTFMGLLLGLALAKADVVLVNVSPQLRDLLFDVGLDRVVRICDGLLSPPQITLRRIESGAEAPADRLRLVLEAHENLARLDKRNREVFEGFLRALRSELESGGGA